MQEATLNVSFQEVKKSECQNMSTSRTPQKNYFTYNSKNVTILFCNALVRSRERIATITVLVYISRAVHITCPIRMQEVTVPFPELIDFIKISLGYDKHMFLF